MARISLDRELAAGIPLALLDCIAIKVPGERHSFTVFLGNSLSVVDDQRIRYVPVLAFSKLVTVLQHGIIHTN